MCTYIEADKKFRDTKILRTGISCDWKFGALALKDESGTLKAL